MRPVKGHMSHVAISELPARLSENQKAALMSLLADDDPAIYQTVRKKIISHGQVAVGWLRPHLLNEDPVLRRRAQEIILHFARQTADNRFLAFCLNQGEDLDIEEGAWLLACTQYPDINVAAYQAWLDDFANELRERLDYGAPPDQILAVISQYLFAELGFEGNEKNYYDPENSYLNRVMDRRTGNPIILCLVYLLLARRLRLPIVGIGMPGHFLCRFQSSLSEIFVDAFNQGKLWTKADCVKYLLQNSQGFQDAHLSPITPRRMLLRICMNLHHIYTQLDETEVGSRVQRYLVALSN